MAKVADLRPASSAYDVSKTSTGYLCCSAQRTYIRISISAKSAASTPPAPERMRDQRLADVVLAVEEGADLEAPRRPS